MYVYNYHCMYFCAWDNLEKIGDIFVLFSLWWTTSTITNYTPLASDRYNPVKVIFPSLSSLKSVVHVTVRAPHVAPVHLLAHMLCLYCYSSGCYLALGAPHFIKKRKWHLCIHVYSNTRSTHIYQMYYVHYLCQGNYISH